jgi:hypothetical protein
MLQMQHFTSFFLKFKSSLLVKRVQNIKLLITIFSPACCYVHPLHSKNCTRHSILRCPQPLSASTSSRRGRNPEDEIMFLWNAGINLQHCTVSKAKTLQSEPSIYVLPSDPHTKFHI